MQVNPGDALRTRMGASHALSDHVTRLPFNDREDAARQLAGALAGYRGRHPLVLAIPRGAVPIGRIVADVLGGDLDVVLVRKLGAPGNPELAIGAIDERGVVKLNENAGWTGADGGYVQAEAARQLELIRERQRRYRGDRPAIEVSGRTVIVVDDGLATGATMIAALDAVRAQRPARLVCAVPVAAQDSLFEARRHADDTVCLATPSPFRAVGLHYRDFSAVDDEEVAASLEAPERDDAMRDASLAPMSVRIAAGDVSLDGDLVVPESPRGLVLFAHGSGSGRHSRRNGFVAGLLQRRGIATLLFDLLTPEEDADPHARFDVALLSRRLEAALEWADAQPWLKPLPMGLFGASTGAAAAISVAAGHPERIVAVVSRGGRPDLAGWQALSRARTPTLLVVGGADREVLELNRAAAMAMGRWAEIGIVPGATHLFGEPGALEEAATRAADWFMRHFRNAAPVGAALTL